MKIIIGTFSTNFITWFETFKKTNKDSYLVVDRICDLKFLKEIDLEVIIPCHPIADSGLVHGTTLVLDELFITLRIKKITYLPLANRLKLLEIAKLYDVLVSFE